MYVRLYRYSGRENVLFKSMDDSPDLPVLHITPYNTVNSEGFQFILDTLYKTNYCLYKYNNLDYWAYVKIDTLADNMYLYTCTVDPLTTCAHAGCYQVKEQFCEYLPHGDDIYAVPGSSKERFLVDPRIPVSPVSTVKRFDFGVNMRDVYIVLVINYTDKFILNNALPPGLYTYVMDIAGYNSFCDLLKHSIDQIWNDSGWIGSNPISERIFNFLKGIDTTTEFMKDPLRFVTSSIIRCFAIPKIEFNEKCLHLTPDNILKLPFYYKQGLDKDVQKSVSGANTILNFKLEAGHVYAVPQMLNESVYRYISINTTDLIGKLTSEKMNSECQIVIPDVGTINFTFRNIGLEYGINWDYTYDIKEIGYRVYLDLASGRKKYVLVVNGTVCPDYFVEGTTSIVCPFPSSYDIQRSYWESVNQASVSATSSITSALKLDVPGALQGLYGHAEALLSPNQVQYSGASGGSTILYSQETPYLIFSYKTQPNLEKFQEVYGKPAYVPAVIDHGNTYHGSRVGYVKTINCDLVLKGLPSDIVKKANEATDNGVFYSN